MSSLEQQRTLGPPSQIHHFSHLLRVSDELILCIADKIDSQNDLSSFGRVNRQLHGVLLDYRYRRNAKEHGGFALRWGAEYVQYNVIRYSLRNGADPDGGKEPDGATPEAAAHYGYGKIKKLLIDYGNGINGTEEFLGRLFKFQGPTPLTNAVIEGHVGVVSQLVKGGARVNGFKCEPLIMAVRNGHKEIVKLLLEAGANPNATYQGLVTAPSATISLLKPCGIGVLSRTQAVNLGWRLSGEPNEEPAWYPLSLALAGGFPSVALLLAEKYDALARYTGHLKQPAGFQNVTALHMAALGGKREIIELLIEAGANVNARAPQARNR